MPCGKKMQLKCVVTVFSEHSLPEKDFAAVCTLLNKEECRGIEIDTSKEAKCYG